jgi:hypothetical protein
MMKNKIELLLVIIPAIIAITFIAYRLLNEKNEYLPYLSYQSDTGYIQLIDNKNAINPSMNELMAFLKYDQTDKRAYLPNKYVCAEFAETLHNNAEAYGYRCAWVKVGFIDDASGHACNAFETTDKGIIYIDASNSTRVTCEGDMIVDLQINHEYRPRRLFSCKDYMLRFTNIGIVSNYELFWKGNDYR